MYDVRHSELLLLAYFATLALAAWLLPRFEAARPLATLTAAATALALGGLAAAPQAPAVTVVRDWLPAILLVVGYWLPRRFLSAVDDRFERWLVESDRAFFAHPVGRWMARLPRAVAELLEVCYLLVYPMVPAGLVVLLVTGHRRHVDWFWTVVLLAEFACYALLPLLPSRPPRQVDAGGLSPTGASTVRRLNVWFLGHASNGWNTFPSGHVAGAIATALAVLPLVPVAGAVLLALAAGITVASFAGRYHYAADTVAGVATAVAAFALVALLFPLR